MRHHTVRMLGIAAAALVVSVGSASAQGKGHGNGKGKDKGDQQEERGNNRDDERGNKRDDDRDRDGNVGHRTGAIIPGTDRVYGNGHKVPPGLAKKPGHMPPGQYKKRYGSQQGATVLGDIFGRNGYTVTRIVPAGTSQYVYFRQQNGAEQRAIVTPGTTRLQFNTVPANILQAVLAQLY